MKQERNNKLIQEYLSGKSLDEVGKLFNISKTTIHRIIIRNNIERRPMGFQKGHNYYQHPNCKKTQFKKNHKPWNEGFKRKDWINEETEEIRRSKISKSLKKLFREGKRISYYLGKVGPMKGRKHSNEAKKKMSLISSKRIGSKAPAWKGGITNENKIIRSSKKFIEWRKNVFERDDYTCQFCYDKGGCLEAHHIKKLSLNKHLAIDINNGITLCKSCHRLTKFKEQYYESTCNFILNINKNIMRLT